MAENIVYAKLKEAKISPRKFGLVAALVRGKNAKGAIEMLKFVPKKGARVLSPVILSALKNASNNFNLNEDNMVITDIKVGPGKTAKSGRFSAKGRFNRIRKRSTNVTVVLKDGSIPMDRDRLGSPLILPRPVPDMPVMAGVAQRMSKLAMADGSQPKEKSV